MATTEPPKEPTEVDPDDLEVDEDAEHDDDEDTDHLARLNNGETLADVEDIERELGQGDA